MDGSADQWDGRTAGRPRGTANGRLWEAGLGGLSFINERVCVRGWDRAGCDTDECPQAQELKYRGFRLPGLSPKAWRVRGHYQKPTTGPLAGEWGQASAHDAGGALSISTFSKLLCFPPKLRKKAGGPSPKVRAITADVSGACSPRCPQSHWALLGWDNSSANRQNGTNYALFRSLCSWA